VRPSGQGDGGVERLGASAHLVLQGCQVINILQDKGLFTRGFDFALG
jgi:hypothetical protein